MFRVICRPLFERSIAMPESRTGNPDLNRAFSDAKKQAGNVAGELQDAAEDLYTVRRVSTPHFGRAWSVWRSSGDPWRSECISKALSQEITFSAFFAPVEWRIPG
jgi:hypothetical protein